MFLRPIIYPKFILHSKYDDDIQLEEKTVSSIGLCIPLDEVFFYQKKESIFCLFPHERIYCRY